MIDTMFAALAEMMTFSHLFFLCLGTMLGLLVGLLPGLGGIAGLSILLPFVFGMDESHALSMMIGQVSRPRRFQVMASRSSSNVPQPPGRVIRASVPSKKRRLRVCISGTTSSWTPL